MSFRIYKIQYVYRYLNISLLLLFVIVHLSIHTHIYAHIHTYIYMYIVYIFLNILRDYITYMHIVFLIIRQCTCKSKRLIWILQHTQLLRNPKMQKCRI